MAETGYRPTLNFHLGKYLRTYTTHYSRVIGFFWLDIVMSIVYWVEAQKVVVSVHSDATNHPDSC